MIFADFPQKIKTRRPVPTFFSGAEKSLLTDDAGFAYTNVLCIVRAVLLFVGPGL